MSRWAHINGSIRFDGIAMLGMSAPDLGKTVSFEDPQKKWNECTVPMGSEGSIQHYMWKNPSESSLAAYTAMFWGDLRDFTDEEEILDYFKRVVKDQIIRSGIVEITTDKTRIYQYDNENNKWKFIPDPPDVKWIE